jgi:hypothetical protein
LVWGGHSEWQKRVNKDGTTSSAFAKVNKHLHMLGDSTASLEYAVETVIMREGTPCSHALELRCAVFRDGRVLRVYPSVSAMKADLAANVEVKVAR